MWYRVSGVTCDKCGGMCCVVRDFWCVVGVVRCEVSCCLCVIDYLSIAGEGFIMVMMMVMVMVR